MTQSYDLSTDYKTAFMADVSTLISAVVMPREARVLAVQTLIDAYVRDIGKSPDSAQLERLADALLYEELTDPDKDKVLYSEYPILSDIQMERRRCGRRGDERTNMHGETSLSNAEHVGTDGRDYRVPNRRKRTIYELIFVDQNAKIRNRERAAQYKRDTSAGPLARYNLRDKGGELMPDFVKCIGTSEHMRRMADRVEISG